MTRRQKLRGGNLSEKNYVEIKSMARDRREKTCPPCLLLVMVGVAGELAVELELLLEKINWNNCQNAKLDVKFCVVKLQKEFQNKKNARKSTRRCASKTCIDCSE